MNRHSSNRVCEGVFRLKHLIVNSFFISNPGSSDWVLIDAGLWRFSASKIFKAARERFSSAPRAIILTHGHFDHVGAIMPLLQRWNVPVYAHPAEFPFLNGEADYPPPSPLAGGGMMSLLSFLYPRRGINISEHLRELPEDGSIPHLPGWRWIHTPGHTPGHVALFRDADAVLLPADALITVKQESFWGVLTQHQKLHGPPAYFTPDWYAARQSVQKLASLRPKLVAAGHGVPMGGEEMQRQLSEMTAHFLETEAAHHGRYKVPKLADAPAFS